MTAPVAIVGLACRYPDADSPAQLWDNVLAQRRAFRRIPPLRLRLQDYEPQRAGAADSTYVKYAALLEGYAFDRVRFRVGAASYRSADLAHWLALDVAAEALADAGFTDGHPNRRHSTGVLLGNSLTGEFSRASQLRLRWPYVQRTLASVLNARNWDPAQQADLFAALETEFKAPFPIPNEESLAGGLSNTIAGRICNHFGFNGGGYTIDGACASSLLAVAQACSALVAGDLDIALAGGVDLSLDPFELVGFARVGALAEHGMRIYDARPTGFLPGEGCGFAVLMRLSDALAEGCRIRAVIRGWGVSSDGKGGLTRPEASGQRLALQRAYARADVGIDRVALFEGHGTGTAIGDATELAALSLERREARARATPAAIGSVKANIGHTKAASGIAGLIKTCMALEAALLPPTTGCEQPHAALTGADPALRVLARAEPWPECGDFLAGVNSMGFGGINVHLVLAAEQPNPRRTLSARERRLDATAQACELFVLDAADIAAAAMRVREIAEFAADLAQSELADLAATLVNGLSELPVRIAVVAATPLQLAERLARAVDHLEATQSPLHGDGVFIGIGAKRPRIGLLFPGQGSPVRSRGGSWRRRFVEVDELYRLAALPDGNEVDTALAQPGLIAASLAALRVLERVGLQADIALGHSIGEIGALAWAGAFDEGTALRIARARGHAMRESGDAHGAMASLALSAAATQPWLADGQLEIAAFNTPEQTVVSGAEVDVEALLASLQPHHVQATRLRVSHAFHSHLVAAAEPALRAALQSEHVGAPARTVASTVTGSLLPDDVDVRELLCQQITAPVRFMQALQAVAGNNVDLWIEVGAGGVLSRLAHLCGAAPALPLDVCGESYSGLLCALGAAYALGAALDLPALFSDRAIRQFSPGPRSFFANPCEDAPPSDGTFAPHVADVDTSPPEPHGDNPEPTRADDSEAAVLDQLTRRLAALTELPVTAISPNSRLLSDLHLNSIVVGQLVVETARALGLPAPASPTDFADASVADVAQALTRMKGRVPAQEMFPAGIEHWVRWFRIDWTPQPLATRRRAAPDGGAWRVVSAPGHHLAESLRRGLDASGAGPGIALLLGAIESDEPQYDLLLDATRLLSQQRGLRFLLVQATPGAAGFARTLHLERGDGVTVVVEVPQDHPDALTWAVDEAVNASGFVEARYDRQGLREEPEWRLVESAPDIANKAVILLPGIGEVLLVTGGGRGIAAECALAIARETGCALAILGRSRRTANPELADNLERFAAAGVDFRYYIADVVDVVAVNAAVAAAQEELGTIVGVLHGAGVNTPRLAAQLDAAAMRSTFAPKVLGLRHVLHAVPTERLRMLITFGSIIARTGLVGEADYALANEWLARDVATFAANQPGCRCLNIEWSVWSGTGMGERLDRIEALLRQGITPISPDAGIDSLLRLCRSGELPSSLIVCGRFGNPPTVRLASAPLPFLRFLERVRFHVPQVELVAEAELSSDNDPFLADHAYAGERLFPAVLGLEAMLQAAIALDGHGSAATKPRFESVRFDRPIVVPEDRIVVVRLAALRRAPGIVDVALRSSSTSFQVDHFRATCRFDADVVATPVPLELADATEGSIALDPIRDLYGPLLPHRGVFKRVRGYRRLTAEECVADIASDAATPWFGRTLPSDLLLGDPGARDAAIHALQACIPHKTILPVGIERIDIECVAPTTAWRVVAKERSRDTRTLVYDLFVLDSNGRCRERWNGLALRIVGDCPPPQRWPLALLGPYVQRRVFDLLRGAQLSVAVDRGERGGERDDASRIISAALREPVEIRRRPDGKPIASNGYNISLAYADGVMLAVAGRHALGCDLERVAQRASSIWRDLLGSERWSLAERLVDEHSEDLDFAATRVWTCAESFKKAGLPVDTPITLGEHSDDGWTLLRTGRFAAATLVAAVHGVEQPLTLALAVEYGQELCD